MKSRNPLDDEPMCPNCDDEGCEFCGPDYESDYDGCDEEGSDYDFEDCDRDYSHYDDYDDRRDD